MEMTEADLTAARVRALLAYEPKTGLLRWITKPNRNIVVGSPAGRVNADGYVRVGIGGRQFQAHRLAWLMVHGEWPIGDIDHINGVRGDNRLENLRCVPRRTNCENLRKPGARNKSGFLGVAWSTNAGKWQAQIKVRGHSRHIGYYEDPASAHAAYVDAKRQLHEGCTL